MENVYKENGYKDRKEYLETLSEEYGMDLDTIYVLADTLGEVEDFDGLVNACEDFLS